MPFTEDDAASFFGYAELCRDEQDDDITYQVVDDLTNKGLLTTNRNRHNHQLTVRIAHDGLIHEWQRFQEWLREERQFSLWLQNFQSILLFKLPSEDHPLP